MVIYRVFPTVCSIFHKFKSFSLTFLFNVACYVIFSQYPNLHNSYVNCFIDSFNCKRDASSVLMGYCPESCIWKAKYLCINGACNSLLIHGISLVNARLLKAFGTAFYAITVFQLYQDDGRLIMKGCVQWSSVYGWEDFASSGDRTRSTRSVGQRLTHWAIGAPNCVSKVLFLN